MYLLLLFYSYFLLVFFSIHIKRKKSNYHKYHRSRFWHRFIWQGLNVTFRLLFFFFVNFFSSSSRCYKWIYRMQHIFRENSFNWTETRENNFHTTINIFCANEDNQNLEYQIELKRRKKKYYSFYNSMYVICI